jgi:hypothetical protein
MATNPLVSQGTLNLLRGSVSWPNFPTLNVTSSFLGKAGIHLALDGEATTFIDTMTGAVTSPQPYQMITLTMHLLKTQGLSDAYKKQMETNALIGDGVVRPDVSTLSPYDVVNCSILTAHEMSFAGDDPHFVVVVRGYYMINSNLWNLG